MEVKRLLLPNLFETEFAFLVDMLRIQLLDRNRMALFFLFSYSPIIKDNCGNIMATGGADCRTLRQFAH